MITAENYESILKQNAPYSHLATAFLDVFYRDVTEEIARVAQGQPLYPGYVRGAEGMSVEKHLENLSCMLRSTEAAIACLENDEGLLTTRTILEVAAEARIETPLLLSISRRNGDIVEDPGLRRVSSRRDAAQILLENLPKN